MHCDVHRVGLNRGGHREACGPHGEHCGPCCCSPHGGIARHFASRGERLEALESYRAELQRELEGLSEHIEALAKE